MKGMTELVKKIKTSSIRRKVFFPLSFLIVAISIIYTLSLVRFGFLDLLNDNAEKNLYYPVKNRTGYLSSDMKLLAVKANDTAVKVNQILSKEFKDSISINSKASASLTEENFRKVFPLLIETTKRIDISGVFLVVNSSIYEDSKYRSGIKIKDNQSGVSSDSNADLQYSRGPSYLLTDNKISMDSFWAYEFDVGKETAKKSDLVNADFYWKPMLATGSQEYKMQDEKGYWSRPYKLSEAEGMIVSYSVPLFDDNGNAYGVFGFDLSIEKISQMIPAQEISYKNSFYLIGTYDKINEKMDKRWYLRSGISSVRFLDSFKGDIVFNKPIKSGEYGIFDIETNDKEYKELYAKPEKIDLYSSNSIFSKEEWYLVGFAPKKEIMSYLIPTSYAILFSLVATIGLGLLIISVISSRFTKPIINMSLRVKKHDYNKPISLDKTGITEIDSLSEALQSTTTEVMASSARFDLTVDLVGAELGSFEYDLETEKVYLTDSLFRLLEIEKVQGNNYIYSALWESIVKEGFDVSEFKYISPNTKKMRWLRMKAATMNNKILGIIIDITREVDERKRVELERDLDMITGLYNRRAFQTFVKLRISSTDVKVGALIFLDLDNLKYINDAYGHDVGDKYIKAASDNLRKFNDKDAILSRISGDEFAIFIQGNESKEALMLDIQETIDSFDSVLRLPDNSAQKVRASIGIAFYPEDADNFNDLIKYADFAMYEIKHSYKGRTKIFNKNSYDKNYYLLNKKEALNELIENKLIYFVYQPIIDAKNGEIMAYEALMRSNSKDFTTPFEILSLAKSQAKLYEIEKLTIFGVLQQYKFMRNKFTNKKIFINSIPNQSISEEDIELIEAEYKECLASVVIELTEEEKIKKENKEPWLNLLMNNGSEIAIDDFGAGYSNEITLITVVPNYVKIDMSLVRDIDRNVHKQKLVSNIISYAKENSIKTIAEGIETYNEMKILIKLDVDYLQGFYLAKPSKDVVNLPILVKDEVISINQLRKSQE
jgi:diguanylate cyclase (GGDEF)-like protein